MLAGCGASNKPIAMASTPATNPTTPSAITDSFQGNMEQVAGRNPLPSGQVTLDSDANNGAGNVLATTGAGANTSLVFQFCSFPTHASATGCLNIMSFTQASNSSINLNFVFPQKGTFAGFFQIVDTSGNQLDVSLVQGPIGSPGVPYHSALLPAGSLTGGLSETTGNAPGSGSISVVGLTAHVMLNGSTPNHTFSLATCASAPCTAVANSNFTTDGQGNASVDVALTQTDTILFAVMDSTGVDFVTAFRVQ
jgi:hypothetical protein